MAISDTNFDFNKIDEIGGFRGDLDPEFLVRLQTNRCAIAQSTGDLAAFGGAVMALLGIIPTKKRNEILAIKNDPENGYIHASDKWIPQISAGWVLSDDPYNPTVTNEPGSLNYNPRFMATRYEEREDLETKEKKWVKVMERGGIHWISPLHEEGVEEPDYYRLFILIQEQMENAGLSWKLDKIEVFTGEQWVPPAEVEDEKLEPAAPDTQL